MGTLLNRRRYMGGVSEPPLPQGAIKVAYLESTGTQYINTGIKVDENSTVRVIIGGFFSSSYNGRSAFGNYVYRATNNFYLTMSRSYLTFVASNLSINMGHASSYPSTNTIEISKDGISINNHTYSYSPDSFISNDIYLFGIQNVRCSCQIGNVYINNGVDCIDYIPCRIGQVGYMYDKISETFIGSASSDDFVPGPDI